MPDPTKIELIWSSGGEGLRATIHVQRNIKLLTGSATSISVLNSGPGTAPLRLRRQAC